MKKILIAVIKGYQKYFSPLKHTKCPYYPSCSNYGLEAVQEYGAIQGSLMAFWRILRCNPFSKGGYDPVPDPDKKNHHMIWVPYCRHKKESSEDNI